MKVGLVGWEDDDGDWRELVYIRRFTWNPLHTIVGDDEEGKVFARWWPLMGLWGTDEFCNPALSIRLPGGWLWVRYSFPLRTSPCEKCINEFEENGIEMIGRMF